MPELSGILESALYVSDLDRAEAFYQRLFGFERIATDPGRLYALGVAGRQVLLLFQQGKSPDHDGQGRLHLAFAVPAASLAEWEALLAQHGVAVEQRKAWDRGGQSIYFRDPDGHLLELATPGVWRVY
jgi:catechol 2,3-dioxygenase-like lactoylglutathione lyase family enzyme